MISEYWLANMRASNVVGATLVAIMVIFGSSATILSPIQSQAANCPGGQCPQFTAGITNVNVNPTFGSAPLLVTFGVTTTGSSPKSVTWSFGDGNTLGGNHTSTTYTYQHGGNYTGTVEVFFKNGQDDRQQF